MSRKEAKIEYWNRTKTVLIEKYGLSSIHADICVRKYIKLVKYHDCETVIYNDPEEMTAETIFYMDENNRLDIDMKKKEKIITYQKCKYTNFFANDIIKHDDSRLGYIKCARHTDGDKREYDIIPFDSDIVFTVKHTEVSKEFETKWCCEPSSESASYGVVELNRPRQVKVWTKHTNDENPTYHWFYYNKENGEIDDDSNASGHCHGDKLYDSYDEAIIEYKHWIHEHIDSLYDDIDRWDEELTDLSEHKEEE